MYLKFFLKVLVVLFSLGTAFTFVIGQGFPKNTGAEKNKYVKPGRVVPNEYIFKLKSGIRSERIRELAPNSAIISIEEIMEDTYKVTYKSDPGIERLRSASTKSGIVEYVQHNLVYKSY